MRARKEVEESKKKGERKEEPKKKDEHLPRGRTL